MNTVAVFFDPADETTFDRQYCIYLNRLADVLVS